MKFAELRLVEPLLRAVATEGYTVATPIQVKAIPPVLEGRDLMGCAQTGTGKTAAFALPILQRLSAGKAPRPGAPRSIRCLVLCPTRELATQISESFTVYGRHLSLRNNVVFGGVNQNPQVRALRQGIDILIATPGRLLDLMSQGHIDLRGVEVLVLDEADRMLDMGFINDIRKVIARVPAARQTLLFSATIPAEIQELAHSLLRDPITVRVTPVVATAERIDESVYFVEKRNKPLLLAHLVETLPMMRAIVFTRTKHGADKVVRHLQKVGIRADAIHGNKSQNNRERALDNFRNDKTPVLVATDIASRGIDVDGITHVVNYDLSHEPETYVHRIGRTARAGASGCAIAFCDREEVSNLRAIEKMLRRPIPIKMDHVDYTMSEPASVPAPEHDRRPARQGGGSRPSRSNGQSHKAAPGRAESSARSHAQPSRGQASQAQPASGAPQYTGRVASPRRNRRGPARMGGR